MVFVETIDDSKRVSLLPNTPNKHALIEYVITHELGHSVAGGVGTPNSHHAEGELMSGPEQAYPNNATDGTFKKFSNKTLKRLRTAPEF